MRLLLLALGTMLATAQAHDVVGMASWYGEYFAGRPTANGEVFDPEELTAAHLTLPFGTLVRVTNTRNGEAVIVRINDRGPYVHGRVIDLSRAAAHAIRMVRAGVAPVEIEILGDDLPTDSPALAEDVDSEPTLVIEADEMPEPVALAYQPPFDTLAAVQQLHSYTTAGMSSQAERLESPESIAIAIPQPQSYASLASMPEMSEAAPSHVQQLRYVQAEAVSEFWLRPMDELEPFAQDPATMLVALGD